MDNIHLKKVIIFSVIVLIISMSSMNITSKTIEKEVQTTVSPIDDSIDWWPMFHHDLDHTGNTTSSGPESNTILWRYNTSDWVVSSPAVVNGKLYFGSNDDNVYCLDAETGELIWDYLTLGDVGSSPAISGGKVYIGSDDHKVYCLDAMNGTKIWEFSAGDEVYSSPSVSDGKVYIGSRDHKVYCLNAVNGTKIWDYTTGDELYRVSPAVSDGKVYIGSYDYKVYCLDAVNGDKIWDYTTGGPVLSSPAVLGDRIYFGSSDCKVYCLNALNGTKIWDYTTGLGIPCSPAVAYDNVYIGSKDYKVYCLDAANGDKIWDYTTGYPANPSPAVADGKVYTGSGDGDVYCLDAFNGTKIWDYTTGDWVWSSPTVVNGIAYIGSNDGILYAFANVSNQPPNTPEDPDPPDEATDVDINADLSWKSIDPDGDEVTYDVYFGTSSPPSQVESNQSDIIYDPGLLDFVTEYFWQIVAWDEFDNSAVGPIWSFTTRINSPPNPPFPINPPNGSIDVPIDINLSWICVDPDGDLVTFDVYFGTTSPPPKVKSNQSETSYDQGILDFDTIYYWRIVAWDEYGAYTQGPKWSFKTEQGCNHPPDKPNIDGPLIGKPGVELNYSFNTTDPEVDNVSYYIDWGDGTNTGWTDYFPSGGLVWITHSWDKIKHYPIRCKAKDIYNLEGNWSDYAIDISVNKVFDFNLNLLERLFECFPLLERLLNLLR